MGAKLLPQSHSTDISFIQGARTAGFSSSSSQMSPDAAGGVIDTRVWGTGQSTSLSGALCMDGTQGRLEIALEPPPKPNQLFSDAQTELFCHCEANQSRRHKQSC